MRHPVDGRLAVTVEGHPMVVDIATGAPEWTGDVPSQAVTIAGTTAVTAAWSRGGDNLVGYDLDSGEEMWRTTMAIGAHSEVVASGQTMWIIDVTDEHFAGAQRIRVVDLATGEGFAFPGQHLTFRGPEAHATFDTYGIEADVALEDGHYVWPLELWE